MPPQQRRAQVSAGRGGPLCIPAPWAGPGLRGQMQEAQALQEAMQEEACPSLGPHLPPNSLQLRPVSFGNLSLKRRQHRAFPEILKDKELEPTRREVKFGPDFYHILQNSLNPLPLWVGQWAGAAALEMCGGSSGRYK